MLDLENTIAGGWIHSPKDGESFSDWNDYFNRQKLAVDEGNVQAMTNLAYCYLNGHGVVEDGSKAFELYNKASENEDDIATARVGWFLMWGNSGVEIDQKKAFNLLRKAAGQGSIQAYTNLGCAYRDGLGTTVNMDEAFACFEKASNHWSPFSTYCLGLMCKAGQGTMPDINRAYQLFSKAAPNYDWAKYEMAMALAEGSGVEVDVTRAIELLETLEKDGVTDVKQSARMRLIALRDISIQMEEGGINHYISGGTVIVNGSSVGYSGHNERHKGSKVEVTNNSRLPVSISIDFYSTNPLTNDIDTASPKSGSGGYLKLQPGESWRDFIDLHYKPKGSYVRIRKLDVTFITQDNFRVSWTPEYLNQQIKASAVSPSKRNDEKKSVMDFIRKHPLLLIGGIFFWPLLILLFLKYLKERQ